MTKKLHKSLLSLAGAIVLFSIVICLDWRMGSKNGTNLSHHIELNTEVKLTCWIKSRPSCRQMIFQAEQYKAQKLMCGCVCVCVCVCAGSEK